MLPFPPIVHLRSGMYCKDSSGILVTLYYRVRLLSNLYFVLILWKSETCIFLSFHFTLSSTTFSFWLVCCVYFSLKMTRARQPGTCPWLCQCSTGIQRKKKTGLQIMCAEEYQKAPLCLNKDTTSFFKVLWFLVTVPQQENPAGESLGKEDWPTSIPIVIAYSGNTHVSALYVYECGRVGRCMGSRCQSIWWDNVPKCYRISIRRKHK